MESLYCNRVVNGLCWSPRQCVRIFDFRGKQDYHYPDGCQSEGRPQGRRKHLRRHFSVLSALLAISSHLAMCAYHLWLITRNAYALKK